ncbi:MAG: PEGA domain-containing protein [Deltaproteobacteria bacterium]
MNSSRLLPHSFFSFLVLALLLVVSLGREAHAKPIRDELPREAREQWDAARELHDAGDFKSALVYFNRAYEMSNNPRTLFNIGVCWKDLTKYSEAIKTWEKQLTFRKKLPKDDIQKAQTAIVALKQFVSTIEVKADEAGAQLMVDGIEVGVTPFLEPIRIDVGRRQLRLLKDGFEAAEKSVDVTRGKVASVQFDLQHVNKTGTVSVTVDGPKSATVYMDGRELGEAPYNGPVSAGPHTFEARATGYATVQQSAEVVYGDSLSVTLSLAEAKTDGKLRVVTEHPDAEIRMDGERVGRGAWEGLLPAGGHQLEVSKPGYSTERIEITLSPEQERTVEVSLSSEKSWLFWTVSVVAVVGGATLATVMLSRPTETTPVDGTLTTFVAF